MTDPLRELIAKWEADYGWDLSARSAFVQAADELEAALSAPAGGAEPLVTLLMESKRAHETEGECHACPAWDRQPCTCGASAWNGKVDAALAAAGGAKPPTPYGSEVLCERCTIVFCPDAERLHFHHDGCPACDSVAEGEPAPADLTPEVEKQLREYLWLSHGHRGQYGDDGEMQCAECRPIWDYKRAPLSDVIAQTLDSRTAVNRKALADAGGVEAISARLAGGAAPAPSEPDKDEGWWTRPCPDCARCNPDTATDCLYCGEPMAGQEEAPSDMVCEQHPEMEWPHGDCAGPGCPLSAKDLLQWVKRRKLQQSIVALEGMVASGAARIHELEAGGAAPAPSVTTLLVELADAARGYKTILRPWLDKAIGRQGTVTFADWDAAVERLENALKAAAGAVSPAKEAK